MQTSLIILISIIIVFTYLYFVSQDIIENFLFVDNHSIVSNVNKSMLAHSIALTDEQNKQEYVDTIVQMLGTTEQQMLKNTIKLYESYKCTDWNSDFDNNKETAEVYDICRQVYYYVNKRLRKKCNVVYYQLNKYLFCNRGQCIVLDIDFVIDKLILQDALHSKVVCIIDTNSKQISFISVKAIGIISEDKIWISNYEDVLEERNSIPYENEYDDIVLDKLRFEDTCKSMQTQDQQLHNLLYTKLMQTPDKNGEMNLKYSENQELVRKMFMDKMKKRSCKQNTNNVYKKYPYKDDFVVL